MLTPNPALPSSDVSGLTTAAVLSAATRCTTPCGEGSLVWHAWGQPDGALPPVVLLHGGSGSWTHWVRNVQAIAASGRYVLAADLPGFGDSALPPAGADADALPEPLEAGLRCLIGERRCDMVGFSFGGMTAVLFAAAFPERMNRLVVVGAPGLGLATRRNQNLKAWRHLSDPAEQRAIHRFNLGALMLHHSESIDEQAVDIQEANVPRDRMPGRRLAFVPTLVETLPRVTCPVHVVYGYEDALYQGRQNLLESTVRGCTPTLASFEFISDAGHWLQYERPVVFNATLLTLLQS